MPDTLLPPVADVSPPRRVRYGPRLGIAAWALSCVLLLFCGAMTRGITYDEDQYVAAGLLARTLLPYRDFVYLQAPLYPFVLAPLFGFAHGWFLLTARLLSFGLALGSGLLLWHLVRRLGAGLVLAMVLLTACLASPFLVAPLANARNDGLPLFLMLAGLAAHLWTEQPMHTDRVHAEWGRAIPAGSGAAPWAMRALAALLFGLAAEAKISYLFAPAVLAIHALFAPRRRLPPAVLGLVVAALPAVYCYAEAPEGFRFGLLGYHLIAPAAWYDAAGLSLLLTPWARLQALGEYASWGGNLTLIVLTLGLSLVATARRRKWKRPGRMLLALSAGAGGLAFVPSPSWAMYYAPLAPLLACCAAHLDRVTTPLAGAARKRALLMVAALPIVPIVMLQALEVPRLLDSGRWVGIAAHRNAQAIGDAVAAAGWPGGEVATLFPMLVMDANPVRPEFSSGPFVFRSGASFSPGLLSRLHALSPATLGARFDIDPPDAIYAGRWADAWAEPMDAPLAGYAEQHGWKLARSDPDGGHLWVRPKP